MFPWPLSPLGFYLLLPNNWQNQNKPKPKIKCSCSRVPENPWEELILVSKTLLLFKRRTLNNVFLRKISPASLSIMPGREQNFEHDAKILGVTLKSITLKFSSILYLTLSSKLSVNSWFTIPYVDVCAFFIPDFADILFLFFFSWQNLFYHFLVRSLYQKPNIDVTRD